MGDTTVKVWVVPYSAFFMPTAFTPNGDGLNDILRPVAIGYKSIKYFRIFNRWGQMLYDSHNIEEGWDGTYHGRNADAGVYFWEINTTDRFGATQHKRGDVTLIR
jgi:gliding motility-associated-like protein